MLSAVKVGKSAQISKEAPEQWSIPSIMFSGLHGDSEFGVMLDLHLGRVFGRGET